MDHFTRSVAAIHAVDHGLARVVTPNYSLPESGVWLSPNLYVEGSEFGPIGLRVADYHLAACECVYIGPKPGNPGRHRLLLLPNGANLPEGVARELTPEGLPNAQDACELLWLAMYLPHRFKGVIFGDERGRSEEASQLEHTFFFAHLLAGNHRLLGATKDPHSTVWSVHGGHGGPLTSSVGVWSRLGLDKAVLPPQRVSTPSFVDLRRTD